jgi:hypothetical protein
LGLILGLDQAGCVSRLFKSFRYDQTDSLAEVINYRVLQKRNHISGDSPFITCLRRRKDFQRIERSENRQDTRAVLSRRDIH